MKTSTAMFIFSEASPLLLFNANAATSWPEAALQLTKKKKKVDPNPDGYRCWTKAACKGRAHAVHRLDTRRFQTGLLRRIQQTNIQVINRKLLCLHIIVISPIIPKKRFKNSFLNKPATKHQRIKHLRKKWILCSRNAASHRFLLLRVSLQTFLWTSLGVNWKTVNTYFLYKSPYTYSISLLDKDFEGQNVASIQFKLSPRHYWFIIASSHHKWVHLHYMRTCKCFFVSWGVRTENRWVCNS